MLDCCREAIETSEKAKGQPLSTQEINQIVLREIELQKTALSKPKNVKLISELVAEEYAKKNT